MLDFVNKVIKFFVGDKSTKDIKEVMPLVEATKAEYAKLQGLSHDELRGKTAEFQGRVTDYLKDVVDETEEIRQSIKNDPEMTPENKEELYNEIDKLEKVRDEHLEEILLEILPEAFAVVKETARRFMENTEITSTATDLDKDLSVKAEHMIMNGDKVTYKNSWLAAGAEITWNMLHYDVQLIGGIILHQGKIAEMATGEGKTLVATLPAYLNGLTGYGVHVVTVNDYLARRDCEWMTPIFNFLGLTVDCIDRYRPHSADRRKAYKANITYGTNNEFGFDYLRDNMVHTPGELVQGKPHYAMIDEVDSVLIDDARTPLIISGPVEKGDEHEFEYLKPRIKTLVDAQNKLVRKCLLEAKQAIKEGRTGEQEGGLSLLRAFRGLPKLKSLVKYMSETGVKTTLLNTENFYLQEQAKRMPEVDAELYFVIDMKNNTVDLTDKGIDLITKSGEDPQFFILPDIASEIVDLENSDMEGAELAAAKAELLQDYAIKSERVHSVQQLLKAYTLFEKDTEYILVDGKVKIVDGSTGRVMEGRRYSDGLHQALEAKENVKVEAITQTFATVTLQNFFRMYHKLAGMTGTAETEAGEFWEIYKLDVVVIPTNRPIARDDKEDLVYKTTREKYNAVIDEIERLRNNGQPILVGTTSVEISELLGRMLRMKGIPHNVLNAKQHEREAEIVAEAGRAGQVTIATNMAGRGTDIKLGPGVKEAGGLAIVGTERHDSRRVDRQLRGRAGRQGDPGSSQFFVSLEDDLMRKFGSDRIAKVMDKMGHEEGDVIQHSMISKSIATAQKKVEENNFGIRKRLLDYDEVMNAQRTVVYAKRKHALFGERLTVDLYNGFSELCYDLVFEHRDSPEMDYEWFKDDVLRHFALDTAIEEEEFEKMKKEDLAEKLYAEVSANYKLKTSRIAQNAWPIIKKLYEERGKTLINVVVPVSDGKREIRCVTNLENAYNTECKSLVKEIEKSVSLAHIDQSWKENLRSMDDLKQAVQTATYEQKDPLLIYKTEAFGVFRTMVMEMNRELTDFLFKCRIPGQDETGKVREAQAPKQTDLSRMKEGRGSGNPDTAGGATQAQANRESQKPKTFRRTMPKVKRNDPCPCGSGKKFKQCHGKIGGNQ